uniref:IPT/TIG domain-containing protein n=1 Tax=Anisakis simplex TaxID=6269 RepID=A0A0M3J7D3_ANISI
LLQRPHMVVMDEDRAVKGPKCTIERDDLMHCFTPDLMIPHDRRNHPTIEHPLLLDYGFEMDGVRPGNISQLSGFNRMEIFPDPIVERFVDGRSYRSGDYLTINGKYLDAAASERDVQVKIGDELCNLTALANRALTCLPPDPTISNQLQYNDKPRVIVKIGGMNYDVGELVYNSKESDISPQVLVAISVAILGFHEDDYQKCALLIRDARSKLNMILLRLEGVDMECARAKQQNRCYE